MSRYPLCGFFVLAFTVTWAWEFLALGVFGWPMPANAPGVFLGPTGAAFAVTAITQGRGGVRCLLNRYVRWRIGIGWYVLAIVGVPALLLLSCLAHPGALADLRMPGTSVWLTYLGVFLMILFVGGPLAEEPGWRGFALPRLQERYGPTRATLVLGVLHGGWHLPLYLLVAGYNEAPDSLGGMLVSFGLFIANVTFGAVHITWLYNRTRGSLIPVMLLHAANNSAAFLPQHMFPDIHFAFGDIRTALFAVTALMLILFTRGRLGAPARMPTPVGSSG